MIRRRLAVAATALALGAGAAWGASPAPAPAATNVPVVHDGQREVDPFCVGITGTPVEACVGSMYDTMVAIFALVGLPPPF